MLRFERSSAPTTSAHLFHHLHLAASRTHSNRKCPLRAPAWTSERKGKAEAKASNNLEEIHHFRVDSCARNGGRVLHTTDAILKVCACT